MIAVVQLIGIVVVGTFAVAALRVIVDIYNSGIARIREVREEGGGLVPKWRGELAGGQRKPSTARAHGLHMVVRGGQVHFREKSVMSKDVA